VAGHTDDCFDMSFFDDLSDDELAERLAQRGIDALMVAYLVQHREERPVAADIELVLQRHSR
jgi:hypothetical protein